jgi:hypothetical protein
LWVRHRDIDRQSFRHTLREKSSRVREESRETSSRQIFGERERADAIKKRDRETKRDQDKDTKREIVSFTDRGRETDILAQETDMKREIERQRDRDRETET